MSYFFLRNIDSNNLAFLTSIMCGNKAINTKTRAYIKNFLSFLYFSMNMRVANSLIIISILTSYFKFFLRITKISHDLFSFLEVSRVMSCLSNFIISISCLLFNILTLFLFFTIIVVVCRVFIYIKIISWIRASRSEFSFNSSDDFLLRSKSIDSFIRLV